MLPGTTRILSNIKNTNIIKKIESMSEQNTNIQELKKTRYPNSHRKEMGGRVS